MRQDYDDYDTGNGYGRSSAVSWLVMGAAALGFLGLGWYAFSSSGSSDDASEVVTLDAYEDPYKQEPTEKGGMEFPHQDKTIYDALDGNTRDESAEKLFPEPEEPVIPEVAETTKAAEEVITQEGDAESIVAEVPVAEKAEKAAEAKEEAAKKAEEVVAAVKTPVAEKAPEPVKVETPKPTPAPVITPPAVKAPATPKPPVQAAAPATGGSYAVQLGAFKSDAEAKQQWAKISGKHGSVLGGTRSVVVRADLPNGTFYRLRAVGFASEAAAKSACASLTKAGQGCFFAGK